MASNPDPSGVVIYHNPSCSTSRKVLALIRERGIEPKIIEYLKTPPTPQELVALAERMGVPLAGLLRKKAAAYAARGLGGEGVTEQQILDAIAADPVLIERPVVVTPLGARLGRPPEAVLAILPR
ncbi:MAG: arsenate reductase (glutaredoxin) [Hyphomicrobiaceae bacterium]|nr:arsenate reductase (glutaredoxin) [Hyphomicrobiaceae bacterium]